MKAKSSPLGESPLCVHASGHLDAIAPGHMEGAVEFPVRGSIEFKLRRMPDDRVGSCAKLICPVPYSEATVVLIQDPDDADHWHGFIDLSGYTFRVRLQKEGKRMAVTFFDSKQPVWCDEAIAAMSVHQ